MSVYEPSRSKYRKFFKSRIKGVAYRGTTVEFGQYALKCLSYARIDGKHIETARRTLNREMKKVLLLYIRIFSS